MSLRLVAAVRVEVVGQAPVSRVGGRRAPRSPRGSRRAAPCPLEHLLLRAGLPDLDLHEEEALLGGGADLRDGDGVGHERDRGHEPVAAGQGGAELHRDHRVEVGDPVLVGVEEPGRVVDRHEGVQGEGLPEVGAARHRAGVRVGRLENPVEQLERRADRARLAREGEGAAR